MPAPRQSPPPTKIVWTETVCGGCGCLCDDIRVSIADNRIVATESVCELGEGFLKRDETRGEQPAAKIGNAPAPLDEELAAAVDLFSRAKRPLIYDLGELTTEAQREAIALADEIGAAIDTAASFRQGPTSVTFHGVGEVTCSLGEIANRCNVLLFWQTDPERTHPRHLERFSLDPVGMFVPDGRGGRTAILVTSDANNSTARRVDQVIQLKPGADFEALWTLRALIKGAALNATAVETQTGVALAVWTQLAAQLKASRFGAILYGDELTEPPATYLNAEAALAVVRDLNAYTRFVARTIGGDRNGTSADQVLTWQTGLPFAISFARGFPVFGPAEYAASALLERGEVDAVLLTGAAAADNLSPAAQKALAQLPVVLLDTGGVSQLNWTPTVTLATADYATAASGTMYRMDEVPLYRDALLRSPHAAPEQILRQLRERLGK